MQKNNLNQKLEQCTFVAFDTETSGAYPIGYDVVEFGAVKWRNGVEVGSLQFLLKPREKMSDFIIGIHGITNEMVANAPLMVEKIREIKDFFADAVLLAHHAPFDMGFMAYEFEKHLGILPSNVVLCTSLMSRKLIKETKNHKLVTLVEHFAIDGGQSHRALDDARACMHVAMECFKRLGPDPTLQQAVESVGKSLQWSQFSLGGNDNKMQQIIYAIQNKKDLEMVYDGGTHKGKPREVRPIGIVRNPDGDFLQATCLIDKTEKRFYLSRILDCQSKQ